MAACPYLLEWQAARSGSVSAASCDVHAQLQQLPCNPIKGILPHHNYFISVKRLPRKAVESHPWTQSEPALSWTTCSGWPCLSTGAGRDLRRSLPTSPAPRLHHIQRLWNSLELCCKIILINFMNRAFCFNLTVCVQALKQQNKMTQCAADCKQCKGILS